MLGHPANEAGRIWHGEGTNPGEAMFWGQLDEYPVGCACIGKRNGKIVWGVKFWGWYVRR